MNNPPLLLFAFANDQDAYLENLKNEEREIRNILRPNHDTGQIEFLSIGHTTKDDIFRNFELYSDRLTIFHYGGHAGGTQLHLEDNIASAKGLANLFGLSRRLQLVFLNGCSTKGQVEKLFKSGVKAVIATSAPINDTKATEFAIEFYRTLSSGKNIETCFQTALAYLQTGAKIKDKEIISDLENKPAEEPLWGLYVKNKAALGWRIFDVPALSQVEDIPDKPANDFLMTTVFDAVNEYIPFNGGTIKNPAQVKLKKKEHVITNFPSLISIQLSYLLTPELTQKTKERFRQILTVYLRVIRFFSGVFVSDLWEEVNRNKNFKIENELRYLLNIYSDLAKEEANSFDYFLLLESISMSFLENNSTFFISEFSECFKDFSNKGELYKTYLFFSEMVKKYLNQEPEKEKIEKLCNDGEYYLSILLKTFSFLSTYYLTSNKKIFIHKPRFQKETFLHELRVLYGADFAEAGEMGIRREYLNNHSVYLAKDNDSKTEFLSLTPFIVDENAYRDINTPDLQLYSYRDDRRILFDHISEPGLNEKFELSEQVVSSLKEEESILKEFYKETLDLFSLFRNHIGGEASNV